MRAQLTLRHGVLAICFALACSLTSGNERPASADKAAIAPKPQAAQPADGRELFLREWIAGDPRSHAGDGLGPMFNDSSCVACHNQGGPGGGGPASKNVQILSKPSPNGRAAESFVLHRFSTEADYAEWRAKTALVNAINGGIVPNNNGIDERRLRRLVLSELTAVNIQHLSQRNTTALFGAGLIDAVADSVLQEAAERKFEEFPEVTGRVARDKQGRIGRFGWKAQIAGLEEFVLTACKVELGLEVPGHPQPGLPHKENPEKANGLDLSREDCNALISYVGSLPAPKKIEPMDDTHAAYLWEGETLFEQVGCATCHTPKLGEVAGIYGDLLLHDMGQQLNDIGSSYGVRSPGAQPVQQQKAPPSLVDTPAAEPVEPVLATSREWRTPPLWGVRDSAPYLHDGRANTLEMAIAFHGGEAQKANEKFQALKHEQQQQVIAFLKSLVAP